jgi:hypothetical protein
LSTPIADEEPTEDSGRTQTSQTSQTDTNRDVFVLDSTSLFNKKSLPPATERGRTSTPVTPVTPVEIRDDSRTSAPVSPTRNRPSTPILAPVSPTRNRPSTPILTPMQIDNNYNDDGRYLTIEQFNYTMDLLDGKINSMYKLLRHVSNQQQKDSLTIQKLAVVDELSDEFWNVSYFNILCNFILLKCLKIANCLCRLLTKK